MEFRHLIRISKLGCQPVAVMSASMGMFGGARAQYHLRQIFVSLNMYPVNRPEVIVTLASRKIDENGMVTDELR